MGFNHQIGVSNMLTLIEKGFVLIYVAPFFAFFLGMMWQYATWQLDQQERGENE